MKRCILTFNDVNLLEAWRSRYLEDHTNPKIFASRKNGVTLFKVIC